MSHESRVRHSSADLKAEIADASWLNLYMWIMAKGLPPWPSTPTFRKFLGVLNPLH